MAKINPNSIRWKYEAVSAAGKRKRGVIAAESRDAAIEALVARGLTPFTVAATSSLLDMELFASKEDRQPKFKLEQAENFARQLHALLDAGVAVSEALDLIATETSDATHKKMYKVLADKVMAGATLSAAMTEFPKCFDDVFIAHIRSGERTGDLPGTTGQLAMSLGKQTSVRNKIKAVTAYPKMMSIAISLIVIGILAFLVPIYAEIYAGYDAELPAPTRAVVKASEMIPPVNVDVGLTPPFIHDLIPEGHTILTAPLNFLSPIFWVIAGFFGYRSFRRKTADNRIINARVDRAKFAVPVFGKLWKANVLYRWSSTFAGSLTAGLSMNEAIEVAAGASGSDLMHLASDDLRQAVVVGKALSAQMKEHPFLFNNTTVSMTATGEKTGEMARMHANRAKTIDGEVEVITAKIGARIEVGLLVLMGAVVGVILVALYLPIFGLSDTISNSYSEGAG